MTTNPAQNPSSSFGLRTETGDNATVVRCSGHLTFDVAAHFKTQVWPLISETKCLVIDLTDVAYMDSSGLGAVMSLYVSAKKAGCEFHLINFNKRVRQLLGMTNVLSIFETCGKFMIKLK
ncbi:MAG: STAS domain-containing protein [Terriglobia bacterium]|jgi:anti-anti-sigma factor